MIPPTAHRQPRPRARSALTWLRLAARGLGDLVFPPGCAVCGIDAALADDGCCDDCRRAAKHCRRVAGAEVDLGRALLAAAPYRYEGIVREAVCRAKFGRDRRAAAALGIWLGYHLEQHAPLPSLHAVVPVPLTARRWRMRGFNQAEEIARAVAGTLGLPLRPDLLARVEERTPQSRLGGRARRDNLIGAFECAASVAAEPGYLLLVDDVITTGSTARECSHALHRAGADGVVVAVVAVSEESRSNRAGR